MIRRSTSSKVMVSASASAESPEIRLSSPKFAPHLPDKAS
jgi:hypothetical protein